MLKMTSSGYFLLNFYGRTGFATWAKAFPYTLSIGAAVNNELVVKLSWVMVPLRDLVKKSC
jgi:hypothetical protein